MRHWFINAGSEPETWREAFPHAQVISWEEVSQFAACSEGIVWCRMSAGQPVSELVGRVRRHAAVSLVVMSDEPDDAEVLQAVEAGASAYCNSRAAPEVLHQIALVVTNGGLWIGQSLLQKLVGSTSRILAQRQAVIQTGTWQSRLSEREVQVARLVAAGSSNKEIADQLVITERTVKAHLTAIFEKLGVRDRLQLSLRINGLQE